MNDNDNINLRQILFNNKKKNWNWGSRVLGNATALIFNPEKFDHANELWEIKSDMMTLYNSFKVRINENEFSVNEIL